MSILDKINFPSDLREVPEDQLESLCAELRQKIIDDCTDNPGHLGSSLGVVELTVALHYVFETPTDKLVWDVGHQSYAHKILTGRKDKFKDKRRYGSISGFPKMSESEYDSFGTGHSSTSISAALGMAVAAQMSGQDNQQSIAVIGDGSMTGGMAFEAINNAGVGNSNILIVLNDNNIAIDPNVGGFTNYLLDISTSRTYNRLKIKTWNVLDRLSHLGGRKMQLFFQKLGDAVKTMLLKRSNFFEAMGLRYFGPVDGHDVRQLVKVFRDLKDIKGPKLLHCITVKGKGYKFAEDDKTIWHAPGCFDKETGERVVEDKTNQPPRFQDVFGRTIIDLAKHNDKIVGITPAMPTGCSLNMMMNEMPDRCFDVGIAEPHAVTFSAGLATQGYLPFCNIYSSFMQRSFDQVIHDVALQNLNVIFCLDRAGLVDADGATHHGAFDLAYMRCIPNMTVAAPFDEGELRNMMYSAQLTDKGPFSIRYPRGRGFLSTLETTYRELEIGKGRCVKEGKDVAIISLGTIGNTALKAINNQTTYDVALYDMRFLKPLDTDLLHKILSSFSKIITIEDGSKIGGLGSAVSEFMGDNNYKNRLIRMGLPDRFIEHGTQSELHKECLIDEQAILDRILEINK